MGSIQNDPVWKRFIAWTKNILVICWVMWFVVLSVSHLSRYDYVYGLPENTLPLYLEEGKFLRSVKDRIQNEISIRYRHLSGSTLAEDIHVDSNQAVHVAARETIGQLKIVFVSPVGEMTLVEVSENNMEISLPTNAYEVYFVGEHFWGEAVLTVSDF